VGVTQSPLLELDLASDGLGQTSPHLARVIELRYWTAPPRKRLPRSPPVWPGSTFGLFFVRVDTNVNAGKKKLSSEPQVHREMQEARASQSVLDDPQAALRGD
jgi:hypothetical protein